MTNVLLLRRRGMMRAADKQVITLNQSDFLYGKGNSSINPYYATNNARIIYPYFDLLMNETGAWQFVLDTNYATTQMGFKFFTENTLTIVSAQGNIIGSYYDPGWQSTNVVLNIPSTFNNSPIVGFTVTMRQSTSNPTISANFTINSFIARKL